MNPVEAHIVGGDLAVCLIRGSLKAFDLRRDPRAFLHTPILERKLGTPGEFKLRGRAVEAQERELKERIADTLERRSGWRPPDDWHFFTFEVESAVFHRYDEDAAVHRMLRWTPKRGAEDSTRTEL